MNIHVPPGNLDLFLRHYRKAGTRFILEAGSYQTAGAWAFEDIDFCMIAPDCSLEGDPAGGTTISMPQPRNREGAPYYEMLTGGARTVGTSSRMTVQNLTIVPPAEPTVALHLYTTRATVRNVHVQGLDGSREVNPGEGFGILVNSAATASIDGHHLVEDCSAYLRPGSYACAIYVGVEARPGVNVAPSLVRNCLVAVLDGGISHCGFGINSRTTLEGCSVVGCERPYFSDTNTGTDSVIRHCQAYDCGIAVEFRVEQTAKSRERIVIEDSTFVFRRTTGYVAGLVLVTDGNGVDALIKGVTMRRCRLINTTNVPAFLGSASGRNIQGITLEDVELISESDSWKEPQLAKGAAQWKVKVAQA